MGIISLGTVGVKIKTYWKPPPRYFIVIGSVCAPPTYKWPPELRFLGSDSELNRLIYYSYFNSFHGLFKDKIPSKIRVLVVVWMTHPPTRRTQPRHCTFHKKSDQSDLRLWTMLGRKEKSDPKIFSLKWWGKKMMNPMVESVQKLPQERIQERKKTWFMGTSFDIILDYNPGSFVQTCPPPTKTACSCRVNWSRKNWWIFDLYNKRWWVLLGLMLGQTVRSSKA